MTFGIGKFRNALGKMGARPTLFQVRIEFPVRAAATTDVLEKQYFLVKEAVLPTETVGTVSIPFQGRMVYTPGDRSYEPLTLNSYNDENFAVRDALNNWMNLMNNPASNLRQTLEGDPLQTNVSITQLSKEGDAVKSVRFFNVFPSSIGEIPLSYGATDTIEEFPIIMTYDYWTPISPVQIVSDVARNIQNIIDVVS